MPRWPAGLHLQSGALPALGGHARRIETTGQRAYWRRTAAELHASAVMVPPPSAAGVDPSVPFTASVGPQGVGELWQVDLMHVQISAEFSQPPLVVQQIVAQVSGTSSTPPPPVVAQVWLNAAGVSWQTGHLLAQTTQGTGDDVALGGQEVSPGQVLTVVWYGVAEAGGMLFALSNGWIVARGTKLVLDT